MANILLSGPLRLLNVFSHEEKKKFGGKSPAVNHQHGFYKAHAEGGMLQHPPTRGCSSVCLYALRSNCAAALIPTFALCAVSGTSLHNTTWWSVFFLNSLLSHKQSVCERKQNIHIDALLLATVFCLDFINLFFPFLFCQIQMFLLGYAAAKRTDDVKKLKHEGLTTVTITALIAAQILNEALIADDRIAFKCLYAQVLHAADEQKV